MSALASILSNLGIEISGSDVNQDFITDKTLKKLPIKIFNGFDSNNLSPSIDLIISSVAYYDYREKKCLLNNPEVKTALEKNYLLLAYPEFLGKLFNESFGIGISGTHGKTTTSALIGSIMEDAGFDPSVIVGNEVIRWGQNSRAGKSPYFILEADEYRDSFLNYQPEILVVGPINYDHPDYFPNFKIYMDSFKKLVSQVKDQGLILGFVDNEHTKEVISSAKTDKILTYGNSSLANLIAVNKEVVGGYQKFDVLYKNTKLGRFSLPLPGNGYLMDALASIGVALHFDIKIHSIIESLSSFSGIKRRFEIKQRDPFVVIDDHAGLPEEIETTIKGIREFFPKMKIWVVFQPHTFSRTEALLPDFAKSLSLADRVIVTDIYAPAREPVGKISSLALVELLSQKGIYYSTNLDIYNYLINEVGKNDVVITMGIGDIWSLSDYLIKPNT